jgi:hypothetical protein
MEEDEQSSVGKCLADGGGAACTLADGLHGACTAAMQPYIKFGLGGSRVERASSGLGGLASAVI